MFNHKQLFDQYQGRDVAAMLDTLQPCLRVWTRDVVRSIPTPVNRDWREDMIATGEATMKSLLLKLVDKPIESGSHLVNSLRKPVKKAMRTTWRKLRGRAASTPETFCEEVQRGEPAYLLSATVRQVDLDVAALDSARADVGGGEHVGECFVDSLVIGPETDPLSMLIQAEEAARRRKLARMVAHKACCIASDMGWSFIEVLLLSSASLSEVAAHLNISRETLRDRLRWIGREIVASATPELDALGREYLEHSWEIDAECGPKGHRSMRGQRQTGCPDRPQGGATELASRVRASFHRSMSEPHQFLAS